MTPHRWFLSLGAVMLSCGGAAIAAPPTNSGDRVREIVAEHRGSIGDLCRAIDSELVVLTPAWDDPLVRWAVLGVPTKTEREQLSDQIERLTRFIEAAEPTVAEALREADAQNAAGIEAAVQLSEILFPLARARALLLYGAAIDPAIGLSEQSQRSFEEAALLAERTETVSAWTAAEQGLILAAASIRLNQPDRSIEAIRAVREAMREEPGLTERFDGLAATRAALETLLVAIARSPVEARESLPEDETDRDRLRVRLAAIAAERSSTPDERDRLLRSEADRQANRALDMALGTPLQTDGERPAWIEFLERSAALIDRATSERLGGSAASAHALIRASFITPADGGAAKVRSDLQRQNLSGLAVLGSILELRVGLVPAASASDLPAIIRAASELHRLAPDAIITRNALMQTAAILRYPLRSGVEAVSDEPETKAATMELIDSIIDRDDLGRSNLDLLAMALLGSDRSFGREQFLRDLDASEQVTRALEWTDAEDADAAWASASVGAALLDRIAREQLSDAIDEGVLSEAEEDRAIDAAQALAARMHGLGGADHQGLVASLTAIARIRDGNPREALETLGDTDSAFVQNWVADMVRTRASLLAGMPVAITSDGDRFGAALFAYRDVPASFSLRSELPDDQMSWQSAPSALIAARSLSGSTSAKPHLVVRCLSAALRTADRETLSALREASVEIAGAMEHPSDRDWVRLIGADAAIRARDDAGAFAILRDLVATTPVEERTTRAYWHASMRMLEILARQNDDGSRTPAIAREIRRLKLQPSWGTHEDICARIDAVAAGLMTVNNR